MEVAATIAVVVSILVFALQARELARQTRLANEVAGTRAHGEIVLHWKNIMDVFIEYPDLRAFYFDQTSETPSASDAVRLLATTNQFEAYHYSWMTAAWVDSIPRTVASSSLLRRRSETRESGPRSSRTLPATRRPSS